LGRFACSSPNASPQYFEGGPSLEELLSCAMFHTTLAGVVHTHAPSAIIVIILGENPERMQGMECGLCVPERCLVLGREGGRRLRLGVGVGMRRPPFPDRVLEGDRRRLPHASFHLTNRGQIDRATLLSQSALLNQHTPPYKKKPLQNTPLSTQQWSSLKRHTCATVSGSAFHAGK